MSRSEGSPALLADRAVAAAERLGLDPATEVVEAARLAARAVDEAMNRAGLKLCDPSEDAPEADRLCEFIMGPGADVMSLARIARRRMLLAATSEILARKWALRGDELLFVHGIEATLEADPEWSGNDVEQNDQLRLGQILRAAKRRS